MGWVASWKGVAHSTSHVSICLPAYLPTCLHTFPCACLRTCMRAYKFYRCSVLVSRRRDASAGSGSAVERDVHTVFVHAVGGCAWGYLDTGLGMRLDKMLVLCGVGSL